MASKWVRTIDDVRLPGNENESSHHKRVEVAAEVLGYIAEVDPGARLYQQRGVQLRRGKYLVPDFTVAHADGRLQVIEIGRLGYERANALERAGHELVCVPRGERRFSYEPPADRPCCKGTTQSGSRCKKRPAEGNYGFCSFHRDE